MIRGWSSCRFRNTLAGRWILLSILLPFATACAPPANKAPQNEPSTAGPVNAHPAAVEHGAPTLSELAGATYFQLWDEPVTLVDGHWRGPAYAQGAASAPTIGLFPDFRLTGDLNGDGRDEAVVLLWSNSGGSGSFDFVVVMGRDGAGEPANIATAALGDRVKIRAGSIDSGQIVLDVIQAGPGDAACCPGQRFRRTFVLENSALKEISTKDRGRQTLADLSGTRWTLEHFGEDEALPAGIEVTLDFDQDRISGSSGCNRYMGGVVAGAQPGEVSLSGPLGATRMACPPPAGDVEQRYLAALEQLTQYSFLAGKLVLSWRDGQRLGTLTFRELRTEPE